MRVATGERYVSFRNVTRYAPGRSVSPRTGVVLVCSKPSPSTLTTAGGSAVSLSVALATGAVTATDVAGVALSADDGGGTAERRVEG